MKPPRKISWHQWIVNLYPVNAFALWRKLWIHSLSSFTVFHLYSQCLQSTDFRRECRIKLNLLCGQLGIQLLLKLTHVTYFVTSCWARSCEVQYESFCATYEEPCNEHAKRSRSTSPNPRSGCMMFILSGFEVPSVCAELLARHSLDKSFVANIDVFQNA